MRRSLCLPIMLLIGLFLSGHAMAAAPPVASVAQAETQLLEQELQTVLLAVAHAPTTPASKSFTIANLQHASLTTVQATSVASTEYLVISASVQESGSTAKIGGKQLTIPLSPLPADTLAMVFTALGAKNGTLGITGVFTLPTVRVDCWLFVVKSATHTYDVTASAQILTGAQVQTLANSMSLSFQF